MALVLLALKILWKNENLHDRNDRNDNFNPWRRLWRWIWWRPFADVDATVEAAEAATRAVEVTNTWGQFQPPKFVISTVPKKLDHFKQTKSEFRFNQRSSFLKQLTWRRVGENRDQGSSRCFAVRRTLRSPFWQPADTGTVGPRPLLRRFWRLLAVERIVQNKSEGKSGPGTRPWWGRPLAWF